MKKHLFEIIAGIVFALVIGGIIVGWIAMLAT